MNKSLTLFITITMLLVAIGGQAQIKIAEADTMLVNPAPHPSAVMEASAQDKGVLLPRMTTLDRDGIANPATGLVIYNLDDACLNWYDGTQWNNVCDVDEPREWADASLNSTGYNGFPSTIEYVAAAQALDNSESVVVTDDGKMIVGDLSVFNLIYGNRGETNYNLNSYDIAVIESELGHSAKIAARINSEAGDAYSSMAVQTDSQTLSVLAHTNTRMQNRFGTPMAGSVEIMHFGETSNEDTTFLKIGTLREDHLVFGTKNKERFRITVDGDMGVGTTTPTERFEVSGGNIKTSGSFISGTMNYPDYVFEAYESGTSPINKEYTFKSLEEVEAFIAMNNHLPGVTSIKELEKTKDGYIVNMSTLSIQTLEKVEELYLHTIAQKKEIEALKAENEAMKARLDQLESLIKGLQEDK